MTSPDELSKDSIEDVLAAAEAILHDPVAAPRFAVPCVRQAWAIQLEGAADMPAALREYDGLAKAQRVRFADAWQREEDDGGTISRGELLEQVRVLRRTTAAPNRRMLYGAWALMAVALLGILMLRMYSGSVGTTQESSVGAWRVEIFAIKEFRGPSAVFRAADADFKWKGPRTSLRRGCPPASNSTRRPESTSCSLQTTAPDCSSMARRRSTRGACPGRPAP